MRRRFAIHKTKTFDYSNYLTIEALEDNLTVTFTNDIEYTIDGNEWITLKASSESQPINIGQTLSFRGELIPNKSNGIGTFTINKRCNLKGNCMSMLFGDNAANNYSLRGKNYAFYGLFQGCSDIVNVDSNFLPATTLTDFCYDHMFYGCTSLTTAPELPATTLELECYGYMFQNCSSLTTAPELPATTLVSFCYIYMFYGCTRISTIRCRARKKDVTSTYLSPTDSWLNRISVKTGNFYGYSTYGWGSGASGIPKGWKFFELTD